MSVLELRNVSLELRNVSFRPRNVSLELRNVSFRPKNVSLELRNVSFRPRNVSLELRNVSFRPRNVSFKLRNVSFKLRNVSFNRVYDGTLDRYQPCIRSVDQFYMAECWLAAGYGVHSAHQERGEHEVVEHRRVHCVEAAPGSRPSL